MFHLAARVYGVMGNLMNKGPAYYDNTMINTNVIEASRKVSARKIIAMGSTAIYSDDVPLPMREEDVWKGAPHGSEDAYAHSKRGMLAQLQAYHSSYGLDFAYCICTNLYGPHDKFNETTGHVVPSLISKFQRAQQGGQPITVWGTGAPERDFLFSRDAATALIAVAETFTGPINIASGEVVSIRSLVETLQRITGVSTVEWDTSKPDGQAYRKYDTSKLAAIDFTPAYSLEEGLRETFQWYCDHLDSARR